VANVRSYFNKHNGSLGTQGSLTFLFDRKSVFKIKPKEGVSLDDLELELIDYGVDELGHDQDEEGNEEIVLYGAFESYSQIQSYLEENAFEIISSEFERIPNDLKDVTPEQREMVNKLIEKLEEDEDVQNVFHNMREEEE
ncbi:MAG: YebC/PmpR family DNA-binding transcriptional regulator, partial [Muribaculaceae bacterium]|nr:YebC/PmpR family DNA-binding transcriptional regulator [Muribaculaceae bacterium]